MLDAAPLSEAVAAQALSSLLLDTINNGEIAVEAVNEDGAG